MILKRERFKIPMGADLKEVDRKVGLWADRKVFGIEWKIEGGHVEVGYWPNTGAAKTNPGVMVNASAGLVKILARCAPAQRNGDAAVAKAESGLRGLRKPPAKSITIPASKIPDFGPSTPKSVDPRILARVMKIHDMGGKVDVKIVPGGYEVIFFGQRLNEAQSAGYNTVMNLLHGVMQGFTMSPQFEGNYTGVIPNDTTRLDWLEARGAGLNRPNCSGGLAHVWVADGLDRPVHHYDQTYRDVIDRAMGYKLMGSTPATRRSKRSA